MDLGSLSSIGVIVMVIVLYLIPTLFIFYWLIKMLKNSNESLKVNKEILDILKSNQDKILEKIKNR
ncbi:hypothetical protein OA84_10650 [Kaistella solincola]|uniref:Uncharacterized protein n=1 Tax=Kaistella solincola TaxID=510955 RepID=A0ABR4ZP37_9FLAO|nr:hypothetical protein OA84_10650 [Kaistella solincola]